MRKSVCLVLLVAILYLSCTHRAYVQSPGNYPPAVGAIVMNKCAVSGCHNSLSHGGADDLDLSSWEAMFRGASTGAVVIPYRPDFSPLCFFTNTDSTLGIALQPSMPYDRQPLSKAEYLVLRDWIASGAPDASGNIKFADDPARRKIYVTNRMCNVVAVLDAASMLQMRYIDVGDNVSAKYPYCIKVSPDRNYWFVSFFSQTTYFQKFDAQSDKLIGTTELGAGQWTSFEITPDSKYGYFADNSSPGQIAYADVSSGSVLARYTGLKYPSGVALNHALNKLYAGTSSGNFIYSIDITDPLNAVVHEVPIDGSGIVQYNSSIDPVELLTDTVTNRCYIACSRSHDIRVVDMVHDSLIGVIPLGSNPAYMALSHGLQKLFVTCPDDSVTFPGNRGAVAVIDLQANTVTRRINTGYQPYGIALDEQAGTAAVVNANISSAGPGSHHVSGCGKKNGNVTFIDLHTLGLVPGKLLEVAVFPFGAAAR